MIAPSNTGLGASDDGRWQRLLRWAIGARIGAKRGPIANKPEMSKWIHESTLSVRAPRHLVITNDVTLLAGALEERLGDHGVWVIAEQLDAKSCRTDALRGSPTILFRLAQKEGRAADFQSRH
jgi:hypothetical protein